MDRFLFALTLDYPTYEQELAIVKKHTTTLTENIQPVLDQQQIRELQKTVMAMTVSDHIFELAVKLVRATRPLP